MQSREEWCFEFEVGHPVPTPQPVIDALLDEAIAWAEPRTLGIGGGYQPVPPEVDGAARTCRFRFGLCTQAGERLIPESQAAELRELLRGWCQSRNLSFVGGFRPYAPAECGEDASP